MLTARRAAPRLARGQKQWLTAGFERYTRRSAPGSAFGLGRAVWGGLPSEGVRRSL